MLDKRGCNLSKIQQEMGDNDCKYWFDFKQHKFLHNIDTFYYSVKLKTDFLKDTRDKAVLDFRNYFKSQYARIGYGDFRSFHIDGCEQEFLLRPVTFAGFYNINIECPELFDIFIADSVPEASDHDGNKLGYSDTCEIIVQLRSYMLWLYGVHESFERSYEVVKKLVKQFGFEIAFAQENRIDYAWHTNYHRNPERFFNIDNLMKMQVSRYKRIHQEYEVVGTKGDYEMDYLSMGKRSDKCFIRIYLKSKEVIEKGYKQFFFKIWLFHGLINRYDLYCYEKAFLKQSWRYVDVARLEYYLEHGTDDYYKLCCQEILEKETYDYDAVRKLADLLTPKLNLVMNIEYQTMRRHSKTYCLMDLKDNSDRNEAKRIYDYLDNRALIIEYLTRETFRLVEPTGDSNKSRREMCPFWMALRRTKLIDIKLSKNKLKLVRDYSRKLNKEVMKKRVINTAITYALYDKGINNDDVLVDCMDALLRLNDNDIYNARKYKGKKMRQLNADELSQVINTDIDRSLYHIIDSDGVIYSHSNT